MTKRLRKHTIFRKEELSALASPARQEIVDVISRMGKVSAAEIAAALERPADALYYHLKKLVHEGLILSAGSRRRNGKEEALFQTKAPLVALQYDPSSKENRTTVPRIIGSMLRLTNRDFRRSLQAGDVIVSGNARELWALRTTGWLTKREVVGINTRMQDLMHAVAKPPGRGRLYGITIVLTPLEHGRRRIKSSSKSTKRSRGGKVK